MRLMARHRKGTPNMFDRAVAWLMERDRFRLNEFKEALGIENDRYALNVLYEAFSRLRDEGVHWKSYRDRYYFDLARCFMRTRGQK